jgi:hypothetical protein
MKPILLSLFVALLMVGCGGTDLEGPETLDKIIAEAIDRDKLQLRGKMGEELYYAPNEQKRWSRSRWRRIWSEARRLLSETNTPTPYTGWAKLMWGNGQIKALVQFKDGKEDGLLTGWYDNGQKQAEGNFKNGKMNGRSTTWYENGQKMNETNFKDGKWKSVVVWKPNGEKCPVTNLTDGNGVWVSYLKDGTERVRQTYKDGKPVSE